MQQTTNYQLNQWDPGDRILRSDFNSDNEKVDATINAVETAATAASAAVDERVTALAEKVSLKLLQVVHIQTQAAAISVLLDGFDPALYQKIHALVIPRTVQTTKNHVSLFLNGNSTYLLGSCCGNVYGEDHNIWCTFFPMYSARRSVAALVFGTYESKCISFSDTSFTSLLLSCFSGDEIKVGSSIRIYGEA